MQEINTEYDWDTQVLLFTEVIILKLVHEKITQYSHVSQGNARAVQLNPVLLAWDKVPKHKHENSSVYCSTSPILVSSWLLYRILQTTTANNT